MAGEDVEKPEGSGTTACALPKASKGKEREWWIAVVLRLLALSAAVSATVVMALNKQTNSVVVGVLGTQPVWQNATAKFQQTPAFVFFVIANAIASFHSLIQLILLLLSKKFSLKKLVLVMIISDLVMVALVSAASAAATAVAEIGKNGNSHARWTKICDKFGTYCDHGAGALVASYGAVGFLIAIVIVSIINLHKKQAIVHCS